MNRCDFGGTLVNATGWLPSAPFDHRFTPAPSPIPGCNNLRCGDCQSEVLSVAGIAAQAGFVPRFAYGAEAQTTLERVQQNDLARLYYCRCLSHTEYATTDLDAPGVEPGRGFTSNWRCGGHPPLQPAETVDGERIDDETIDAVVDRWLSEPRRRLPDGLDFTLAGAPAFWLSRLYGLLIRSGTGRALGDRLEARVVEHVGDPDPVRRYVALNFIFVLRPEAARATVEDAAQAAPGLFRGTVTIGPATFDFALALTAILGRGASAGDAGALDLLKAQVLTGAGGRTALLDIGEQDPNWFLDHAVGLYQAQPDRLSTIVRQVARSSPDRTTALVQGLVDGGADEADIRVLAERYLEGPVGQAVLAALRGRG